MDEATRRVLRRLPSVEELLQHPEAASLLEAYARERVVEAVRRAVAASREQILRGAALATGPEAGNEEIRTSDEFVAPSALLARAEAALAAEERPRLRRVINASGVVVHTNLGRSLLAPAALERVVEVARHYSNLEYRLEAGERGSRHEHVEELLCRLTGAEAAMVVNNNAAAVLLLLSALAAGREVVVSRGQLVEIGGSFRIPDIMRQSGARLIEVGTTNKTHPADYRRAIGPETALILRVHTSNFKVVGFSEEVGVEELVALGREEGVPVADDLGSGAFVEFPSSWDEPSVLSSVRAGVDVVSFSGDKLLGGPQAGILVGSRQAIDRLKTHPLARAVRVDKLTLAGLEGTLRLYQEPEKAREQIPTLRYLLRDPEETRALAEELREALGARLASSAPALRVEIRKTAGKAGGGALPLVELPSHAVAVTGGGPEVVRLERRLRQALPPVIGRISGDVLLLDLLAVEQEDLPALVEALEWAAGGADE